MKIKLEVSKLVASCLQRMIVDEIDNQKEWQIHDLLQLVPNPTRQTIINEMRKLADDLEKQGIQKYIKCY
jgi:hypothetical protein